MPIVGRVHGPGWFVGAVPGSAEVAFPGPPARERDVRSGRSAFLVHGPPGGGGRCSRRGVACGARGPVVTARRPLGSCHRECGMPVMGCVPGSIVMACASARPEPAFLSPGRVAGGVRFVTLGERVPWGGWGVRFGRDVRSVGVPFPCLRAAALRSRRGSGRRTRLVAARRSRGRIRHWSLSAPGIPAREGRMPVRPTGRLFRADGDRPREPRAPRSSAKVFHGRGAPARPRPYVGAFPRRRRPPSSVSPGR